MTISVHCPCLDEQPQGIRPSPNANTRLEYDPRCPHCNGEGNLLVSVNYERPPVPTTACDWSAVIDGHEEYGPYGRGRTKIDAVQDLLTRLEED
jgi:hypothetical protein